MPRFHIGLGGNVGDTCSRFRAALDCLESRDIRVTQFSSVYQTRAVGEHAGDDFCNAAAELEAELEPLELLDVLLDVETQLGRARHVHWGPRTIDLDLLLCENRCIEHSRLAIPHPHFWYRRFVLDPLVEIAPDARHAQKNASVADLRNRILHRPFRLNLEGIDSEDSATVASVVEEFRDATIVQEPPAELTLCFNEAKCRKEGFAIRINQANVRQGVLDVLTAAMFEPSLFNDP